LVELEYESQLNNDSFNNLLKNGLDKDKINHYTNFGIHKDDLIFKIGDFPIKKFGSQGQQKTYLLALKLAQAELIKNISKKNVIILLDDIYDKLDGKRMYQLIKLIGNGIFGQTFITDTSLDRIPKILNIEHIEHKSFVITNGNIK